jgi:rRNA small subunit aminocarboxypropyltransferase
LRGNASSVLIVRDGRESARKCSLTALRSRPEIRPGLSPEIQFRSWVRERPLEVGDCTLLHPEGERLSRADLGRPLLLVDSSWRHLAQVLRDLRGTLAARSIPEGFVTAYPRRSRVFADPESGLASLEALYVALAILAAPRPDLLEGYRFAPEFLERNAERLAALGCAPYR